VIISSVALSADAAPLTQYANFDKGAVGLVLLAFLCRRTHSGTELGKRLRQTVPFALATIAMVMAVAMSIGYIKPDLKFTQTSVLFLASNLFFTVVAEEAFFRGFLQDRLAASLARLRLGRSMALLASALLFGLAHAAGGTTYMLLAALAGLGYAAAYTAVQRIEAPLMVHFALNAVHCVAFTYPHLT
jgi:membrane protease YdiL (CAAX protease family)